MKRRVESTHRIRAGNSWLFATGGAVSDLCRSLPTVGALFASAFLLIGCAGQFELDVPNEHPARASAFSPPIEPAPSPYDQRYPVEIENPEQLHEEHDAEDSAHEMDAELPSETGP